MVTYAQNELVPSTDISKKFGSFLAKVSNGDVEKIGILKNNKIEAVILPTFIYESLIELIDEKENEQLLKIVENRLKTPKKDYLDGTSVLRELNLSLDD